MKINQIFTIEELEVLLSFLNSPATNISFAIFGSQKTPLQSLVLMNLKPKIAEMLRAAKARKGVMEIEEGSPFHKKEYG